MSKKRINRRKKILTKSDFDAIADWLKANGSDAFKVAFETKSEVEKIIDKMPYVAEKTIKEPYTV
jgi:hypothetical protein